MACLATIANKGTNSPSVEEYYSSVETRLGYWLLLGNARHCGYWKPGTLWPFPIGRAQRALEEKLYQRLNLSTGVKVLDAGAGSGLVASYMAEKHGLHVVGVDVTTVHVRDAQRVVRSRGLQDQVSIQMGDYHDLSSFGDASFDGIYTMETFVHADDPLQVLSNFYRLLKTNGVLVLHEADFRWDSELLQEILRLSHCGNTLKEGSYENMLAESGFKDITVEELTDNVLPLWRLFGVLGAVPYDVLRFFGLHKRFINLMAGVEICRHWEGPGQVHICQSREALNRFPSWITQPTVIDSIESTHLGRWIPSVLRTSMTLLAEKAYSTEYIRFWINGKDSKCRRMRLDRPEKHISTSSEVSIN